MKNILVLIAVCIALAGCAAYSRSDSNRTEAPSGEMTQPFNKQMLIMNADITLESDDPDATASNIDGIVRRRNGYILRSGNTAVTLRVDAARFNDTIAEILKTGSPVSKRIYTEDVTSEFRDNAIRLENVIKSRDRYLELLKKAETVEAALKVERELERLNTDIDLYKGKQERLSHLVQYSTISVTINKRVWPGPLGWIFYGLYIGVRWLFVW